jgi:Domain of unknown function (DUF4365)
MPQISSQGAGVLDHNNHQGKFGEEYVRALGSAAGLIISTYNADLHGVDLGFHWPGHLGVKAFPSIEVQVKSWSNPDRSGAYWNFRGLSEVQFNKIAGNDYQKPRYLFLIVVPKDTDAYTDVIPDGMLLRYQGFYVSLHTESRIEQPDSNRRRPVLIPLGNVLTASTLRALMDPDPGAHGVPHPGRTV